MMQDVVNELDSDATGYLQFPSFLALMSKRYSDNNAEDEIREAFRVFDSVSTVSYTHLTLPTIYSV